MECKSIISPPSNIFNHNHIGVKYTLTRLSWDMSLFWPTYWSKVIFQNFELKLQVIIITKAISTGISVFLMQCYYEAKKRKRKTFMIESAMPLSISLSLLSGNDFLSGCTNWKLSNSSRRSSAFDTSASDMFFSASRNRGNARLISEVTSTRCCEK